LAPKINNMSQIIPESELVLNPDGSIYHLALHPEDIATRILLVGDPDRVARISRHFDHIEIQKQKREFVTHTGTLNGQRITVMSTGIGTDNIDIVLNELDALANIDLKTREVKQQHTTLHFIRIGTSGSLQPDLLVDEFLAGTHGLGLDMLMHYYDSPETEEESKMSEVLMAHGTSASMPARPYFRAASSRLLGHFTKHYSFKTGITATCAGFYGPQGRQLRAALKYPDFLESLQRFEYNGLRVMNFEMETAGIYGLGRILGHECLSVNAIIANRATHTFSKDPYKTIDRLIETVLEIVSKPFEP